MNATAPQRSLIPLVLLLQVVIIVMLIMLMTDRSSDSDTDITEELSEATQELASTRYQLQDQGNRLMRMLDRLSREGFSVRSGGGTEDADETPDRPESPSELLDELAHVTEVHNRHKHDPLQREPVEKERARLEELLRRAGDDTIDALAMFLRDVEARYPVLAEQDGCTWFQSRLLTYVVDQIDTDQSTEFARSVFEDPGYNAGVRLIGARIAMKKHEDLVIEKLIDLLENPDPTFDRPEEIAKFFGVTIDARAIPALIKVATDPNTERGLRRFCLTTLGRYSDHRVIDALKEVATLEKFGDLRAVALTGLNDQLGKEILPFVRHLRSKMKEGDPMIQLLDNIELYWQEESGG